ncbi:DUF427 domain-containing protein [Streptomyces sp. 4N124]|uniref:DUF427 domain-containing protein n=1 Tax=Streptomyces sp. 4N124 TaxID=3457420 RepID=UPI003FD19504
MCGRRPNRGTTPTAGRDDLCRHAETEAGCPAVQYIPLADVDQALLERTDSHTYCPYKGEAS